MSSTILQIIFFSGLGLSFFAAFLVSLSVYKKLRRKNKKAWITNTFTCLTFLIALIVIVSILFLVMQYTGFSR